MTAVSVPGGVHIGLPASNAPIAAASATGTSTGTTIPADATAPVWQPWVNLQSQALSRFKTDIDRQIGQYNGNMAAAQRILDNAQGQAKAQLRAMETAAWTAFDKYMSEAQQLYDMIMGPALQAYIQATANAHTRLWENLTAPERAYAMAAADATWTEGLANGGAKLGPEAPIPGQS